MDRLGLVFAGHPTRTRSDAEVEVAHTPRPARILGVVDADADVSPWVTVYEVFVATLLWVVSPIGTDEMARLGEERFDAVIRAAEARRGGGGQRWEARHRGS